MTYSYTRSSIIAVAPYLTQLLQVKPDSTIEFISLNPERLAYKLRQGINSAAKLNDLDYAKLADQFTIKVLPGKVGCQRRFIPQEVESTIIVLKSHLTFIEADSILSVLEVIIDNKLASSLTFPNYIPDEEEVKKLIVLCNDYNFHVNVQDNKSLKLNRVN